MADTEKEITTTEETEVKAETKTEINNDALSKEIEKLKRQLSNANSEAADYKRKLRERQTAEEQAAADLAEKQRAMEAELEGYRQRELINNHKVRFMGLGFDETTAQTTAEAMASGDTESVFANLKSLTESIAKSALAKAMDDQNGLTKGAPVTGADILTEEDSKLREAFGL